MIAYGTPNPFTTDMFTVNGGTLAENIDHGGVTFTPTSKASYVEFQIDAPTLKINLPKNIKGEFLILLDGKTVALKYRYVSSLEVENAVYLNTDGLATIKIQSTMKGLSDYSIDLISYQKTDANPFEIGDLTDWKNSLVNKYVGAPFRITNIYYARALCNLYNRGYTDATVLSEINRIAQNSLNSVNPVTKRLSTAGVFANGVAIHFLYTAYQTTGNEAYRQACIDFIEIALPNWALSTVYPNVYQTTDGFDSITYNHNYFLGEALVFIGIAENNETYKQIGLNQFLGTSTSISVDGHRPHGSAISTEYRNYKYQEAFQNLRLGYEVGNQTLIEDGKKLLRRAEIMSDDGEPDWILQNRILQTDGVYYEVFHENISCIALPYYYMIKNNDYDYGWEDAKKYVENAFTLYDSAMGQFWFSQNYHTDYYTPGTFHSLAWYLESGMYDDLIVDKVSGAVTFGLLEPVELGVKVPSKLRVWGIGGAIFEASLTDSRESVSSLAVNTSEGIKYATLVSPSDSRASSIKIETAIGSMSLAKF